MGVDQHEQIGRLLDEALEVEPGRRKAFLDAACAGDQRLRLEVASLLAFERQADGFMESSALAVAATLLAEDSHHCLVGSRIGCYQILSLLGAGGMGEVYRALDTKLQRDVAIKVLPALF